MQDFKEMFVAKTIAVDHKDLIHDVSYDFHGRRMATCSSDQTVKVRNDLCHIKAGDIEKNPKMRF